MLFEQDTFLNEIMKDDDFRKDHAQPDNTSAKTPWLMEHGADPVELKKYRKVVTHLNAGAFADR